MSCSPFYPCILAHSPHPLQLPSGPHGAGGGGPRRRRLSRLRAVALRRRSRAQTAKDRHCLEANESLWHIQPQGLEPNSNSHIDYCYCSLSPVF